MALLYLDTSALVKIYLDERGSERMRVLASPDSEYRLAVCSITQVEFHAAIWRRHRIGELDSERIEFAIERFNVRLGTEFLRCSVDDRTLNLASDMVAQHGLRAYDAVQLAACLVLETRADEAPTFVCADRRLLDAAEAEGLAVLDPEQAPPGEDDAPDADASSPGG